MMNRITLSQHTVIWFNNCYKLSPFIRNKIVTKINEVNPVATHTNKKVLWEHKKRNDSK